MTDKDRVFTLYPKAKAVEIAEGEWYIMRDPINGGRIGKYAKSPRSAWKNARNELCV